jgi:cyanophycin synthetase
VIAFDDSRRLTGPNLFFADFGVVLEVAPGYAPDAAHEAAWRERVATAFETLGWPAGPVCVRRHAQGADLAFAAPIDQLFTATSVNEWAWQDCWDMAWSIEPEGPPIHGRQASFGTLRRLAAAERSPSLLALIEAASQRGVPVLWDDERFTLGAGAGASTWPLNVLPAAADVDWNGLHGIPAALVTGTNGKTTTVRLLSAIAAQAKLRAGHSSTDGLVVAGESVQAGDYSGPAGARAILRDPRVELAVLETARGGILRRGLALHRAAAAIVTNISVDHIGEYGIDDLDSLADVKLVLARAIAADGLLVLNADDPLLLRKGVALSCPVGWFSRDDGHAQLRAHRGAGGATCGVRDGRMLLTDPRRGVADADLGEVVAMPLSIAGHAAYNVSNLLGAALTASALGLLAEAIRAVLARFGSERSDNPGRLEAWRLADVQVFVDYAHNPDGLRGLLEVARAALPDGEARLALMLGQAGNRGDAELRQLAATAAGFAPDCVVLKDIEGMQRGRAAGEVAAVLRDELLRCGVPPAALAYEMHEIDAARRALAWARAGDVVVLPVHMAAPREALRELLLRLQSECWNAGRPLP